MEKLCPVCQKPFWIRKSHAHQRTTCSQQCSLIYFKGTRAGDKNPSWRGGKVSKLCPVCGKIFWETPSQAIIRVTCSRQCMGMLFKERNKAEGNSNWKGGRLSVSQRIRQCDKNRKLIVSILKRDKYTCQKCGQVGGNLEADHIKPFGEILNDFLEKYAVLDLPTFSYELSLIALKYNPFWDKENMRTLCRKCNRERRKRSQ